MLAPYRIDAVNIDIDELVLWKQVFYLSPYTFEECMELVPTKVPKSQMDDPGGW